MKMIYYGLIFSIIFFTACDHCGDENQDFKEKITLNGEVYDIAAGTKIENIFIGNKIDPENFDELISFSFKYPKISTKVYWFVIYIDHKEVKKGEFQIKYGTLTKLPSEPWSYGTIFDTDVVFFEYSIKDSGNLFKITAINKNKMKVDFNLTWYKGPGFNGLEEVVLEGKDVELKRYYCAK